MIGRARERGLIEEFLDGGEQGGRALVLHGEAGIGKTTLWLASLEAARTRGHRVLVTRATGAEARLPFVGLSDLLADLVGPDGPALPPPQQQALDVALMRAPADAEPMHPLALSLAVLELFRAAAADQPILLAIDDLQWLDESTAGVLRFALRRLDREPVAAIATLRGEAGTASLECDLGPARLTVLPVTSLDAPAVESLLDEALNLQLAPTALRRVHRLSGGNPLHAVELGRALQARGDAGDSGAGDLPLPASLAALVRERLDALPDDAREVATHAAALTRPTAALLAAALGSGVALAGLEVARRAAVLAPGDDPIRFTHPILAAELMAGLDDGPRRELHARLAAAITEPGARARHLALAATGPDASVAAALDEAAALTLDRGAPEAAAELSELAAGQTPGSDPLRIRRLAAAGRSWLLAGDVARARQLLERALDHEPAARRGAPRAELLFRLAGVRQLMDDFSAAEALGREALRHAGEDVGLAVRIRLLLAGSAYITGVGWADGARHASDAMRLAEEWEDPALLAAAIGPYASWRYATGQGLSPDIEQRAAVLEPTTRQLRALDRPDFDLAVIELADGRTSAGYARHRRLLAAAERDGDHSSLPFLLGIVSLGDFLDGRADAGRQQAERAIRLARTTGQRTAQVHALAYDARLAARTGDAQRARAAASEAFDLMSTTSWRVGEWALRIDLALLELSLGDPAAALDHVSASLVPSVQDESGRARWAVPVAVEALVALGRHDEARAALAALDTHLAAGSFRRLQADALRAHARLLAAAGQLQAAGAAIAGAEDAQRAMGDRWELARTLLAAGDVHRRSRRRARARAALEEAADLFATMGAARWAAVAREQLGRVGAARVEAGLTPTQRQVAELVASGLTNREVGARLFMSPHTVEAHLSTVYRSLGIRSRRELVGALLVGAASARDSTASARDSVAPIAAGI